MQEINILKSTSPIVTVIIATYNKASTLRCAIESVLWQTFTDFEVWIVGDACTDNSADVVNSFNDPRLHWYNLPHNTGYQSEPHNEGLRRARGQYIAYLNHDDLWLPNHLQVLIDGLESHQADAAYSIMEWILTYTECYADIPDYPHSPRPPEATAIVHRRDWIDDVGYWKQPHKLHAIPRADYFRRAQFSGKKFALIPILTALKFGGSSQGYSSIGQQPEYLDRIRRDPDFAHTELAMLLVQAQRELDRPTTPKRFIHQISESIRRQLIKLKIDPARLRFLERRGHHIRAWRKAHGLDKLE